MRSLVNLLAGIPAVFDLLRWILEGGFSGHQSVFNNELSFTQDRQAVGTDGVILDLGCGTGQHAEQFDEVRYLGLDLSATYLAAAKANHPRRLWCQADATQLPFRTQSIHTIMICGLLHHLDDATVSRTLSEASRVLADGGCLVVWEDVPTEKLWNLPGMLAHRFDLGNYIRPGNGYRALLEQSFQVVSERKMRSGFMDYAVFVCKPRLTGRSAVVNCGAFPETTGI